MNQVLRVTLQVAAVTLLCAGAHAAAPVAGTAVPTERLRQLVTAFKADSRGPFQAIRWFCPDGTDRPANSPCGVPGGRQHGLHKDEVQALASQHGIYLGQILTGTEYAAFLDSTAHNNRLKQYQLERYLGAVDDGWIMRRARYYRGAVQIEGEEKWSGEFLSWLMSRDVTVRTRFFLARQLLRDLPWRTEVDRSGRIRTLASSIADRMPKFVDLKNKIHSQPDSGDIARVSAFRLAQQADVPAGTDSLLNLLQTDLVATYGVSDVERLRRDLAALPADAPLRRALSDLIAMPTQPAGPRLAAAAELLWRLRLEVLAADRPALRLQLLSLSLDVEQLLFRSARDWQPATLQGLLEKNFVFARASAGAGFLEVWEWETLAPAIEPPAMRRAMLQSKLQERVDHTRRAVGWASGMVTAEYGATVERFAAFEPLAHGFADDMVRRSVLLPWGEVAGQLLDAAANVAGMRNQILHLASPGIARGLNPGYALGTLEVVRGAAEDLAFDDRKIYILERPPADLKPVAGIATVSEGNAVSHVQLLARNLGIPNAVLSPELLGELEKLSGTRVFYAVSPRGRVIIKRAEDMAADELALFSKVERPEERVAVPTDRLQLARTDLFRLRDLRSIHSGQVSGPKAANLGQLSSMFPGRVTEGVVIPFGMFRAHFDQPMPDTEGSYWQFLQATFAGARDARAAGRTEADVEALILQRLSRLRSAIAGIALLPSFVTQMEGFFAEVFGAPLGQVPVFVRSDTNMEDLKDFTGAGLNLTVPNVVDRERLLQAVRDVWASPFTERSYRWRQKVLLNPENVYPSILLQRSVNLSVSGVLITTGLVSQQADDVTVAFSRGVGGAVDGQAAESWLLRQDGADVFLSPAREPRYTSLPATGGIARQLATMDQPVLTSAERLQLRQVALEVRKRLPTFPGVESQGPFDVELGFEVGRLWLFQARPFVESKRAQSSLYLRGLDPVQSTTVWVLLDQELPK